MKKKNHQKNQTNSNVPNKEISLFWIHFTILCLPLSAKPDEISGVLSAIKRKKAFVFYLVALTFLSFSLLLSLCA